MFVKIIINVLENTKRVLYKSTKKIQKDFIIRNGGSIWQQHN